MHFRILFLTTLWHKILENFPVKHLRMLTLQNAGCGNGITWDWIVSVSSSTPTLSQKRSDSPQKNVRVCMAQKPDIYCMSCCIYTICDRLCFYAEIQIIFGMVHVPNMLIGLPCQSTSNTTCQSLYIFINTLFQNSKRFHESIRICVAHIQNE